MPVSDVLTVIVAGAVTLAGGSLASIFTFMINRLPSRFQRGREGGDITRERKLEDRLDELSRSMRSSARLVEEISAELDARAATAKKLREDAKEAEALAAINKEQADAIRRLVDSELKNSERRVRKDSIIIGIGSFIAGAGASFLTTLFVHPLN